MKSFMLSLATIIFSSTSFAAATELEIFQCGNNDPLNVVEYQIIFSSNSIDKSLPLLVDTTVPGLYFNSTSYTDDKRIVLSGIQKVADSPSILDLSKLKRDVEQYKNAGSIVIYDSKSEIPSNTEERLACIKL